MGDTIPVVLSGVVMGPQKDRVISKAITVKDNMSKMLFLGLRLKIPFYL